MHLTPPGGIMDVVAEPLRKNVGWQGGSSCVVGRREQGPGPPLLGGAVQGDLETLDELLAPDFVNHSLLPGQAPNREGYMRTIAEDHAGLSDIRTTIEYQTTDGDDVVITRHTPHGIHDRGTLLGMEPTGTEWTLTHIDIHRISGGKIVEEWSASGAGPFLEMLAQEIRERERIEQELRVARRGRRNGQGRPRCPGDGRSSQHATCPRPVFRFSGRGFGTGQRRVVSRHTLGHVRHLLLWHPRSRERTLELRQRRSQPPLLSAPRRPGRRTEGEGDAAGDHAEDGL